MCSYSAFTLPISMCLRISFHSFSNNGDAERCFGLPDVDEQSKREIKDILLNYDRTLLVADPRRCEPKKCDSSWIHLQRPGSLFQSQTLLIYRPGVWRRCVS